MYCFVRMSVVTNEGQQRPAVHNFTMDKDILSLQDKIVAAGLPRELATAAAQADVQSILTGSKVHDLGDGYFLLVS